jgi:hypothetical protein
VSDGRSDVMENSIVDDSISKSLAGKGQSQVGVESEHVRMARGVHGLPKVSPGPAMPYPSTPCGRATLETALQLFLVGPARRAGGLRLSSTPLNSEH